MMIDGTVEETTPEGFAPYLARYLRAKRGFQAVVPREAEPLLDACDYALMYANQGAATLACIVDRDARPGARFGLSPEDAAVIVRRLSDALRRPGRFRCLVSLTIYEIGGDIASSEAESRLDRYRVGRTFTLLPFVQLVLVNPRDGLVLDNARSVFGRAFVFGWLRRLVAAPHLPSADFTPPAVAEDVGRMPVLTVVLLAALVAIFAAETMFAVGPWTGTLHASIRTLLAFGGVDRTLVLQDGQWWRMVTAPLLHGDAFHILFNGLALWLVGRLSERLMGMAWFAATFAVSALAGSALSIVVNPPNLLSVGASGAIVGLFVASFVLSFHFTVGDVRSRLQARTLGTVVPALVPILSAGRS